MEKVSLKIRDKVFQVEKEVLSQYSDYFSAMFNGNYVENQQKQICIDILDPKIMNIVLQYMQMGLINLSEYPLSTIGDIAFAANFLQITELIKQIENILDSQISECNWIEIMNISENSSYTKLEQFCAAFGLYSFKTMKPEHIPTIHKLAWYLSHPYLDTHCELDVFKFGLRWILRNKIGAAGALIVLGCLDFKRITVRDLDEMRHSITIFKDSLADNVTDCLYELSTNGSEITEAAINERSEELGNKYSEIVWAETLSIVKGSKARLLKYTPAISIWVLKDSKPELVPHCMYTFDENIGLEKWLEVADKNLWGWGTVAWGLTKLVIACGEHGRGTGMFMKDVKVYDTLRNKWTKHGVDLPARRHAGLAVVGDLLYIAGGVGEFRVVLDTVIVYDLKQRTCRKIAKLPDTLQNPAMCSHNNVVYAAGQTSIYYYNSSNGTDCWINNVVTEMRMSCIKSHKEYIYCIQGYFSNLYRFRPHIDDNLQLLTYFSSLPATICSIGDKLFVFTWTICGQCDVLTIEQYRGQNKGEKPQILFTNPRTNMRVNDVAGSCSLVMSVPPLCRELSQYHNENLIIYT